MPFYSKIVGTGLGKPSKVITNEYLSTLVDTNDEWIRNRTGIKERRFVDRENGEQLGDICKIAGEQALKSVGWKAEEVDLCIVCTVSPERFLPNMSVTLTDSLGLKNAGSFDLSGACAGFVSGLHTVDAFIRSGVHKKIMLFGAEAISGALDMSDRNTCVLFGDGAGCVLVEAVEGDSHYGSSEFLASKLYSQYDTHGSLEIPGGASALPFSNKEVNDEQLYCIKMQGQDVFKNAVKGMVQAATEVLKTAGVSIDQVDHFIPHQANIRIIEMVAKMLKFPMEKTYVNLDRWGNTSAATVATSLAEMHLNGQLKRGDLVLCDVFGAGFTYGAVLIRW